MTQPSLKAPTRPRGPRSGRTGLRPQNHAFGVHQVAGVDFEVPRKVQVTREIVFFRSACGDLRLDLYWTKGRSTRPGIVFIHGGGWMKGDKTEFVWFCTMLAKHGYATAAINYRLSDQAKYPAQIEDCLEAMQWMRRNADQYGIDADRLATIGGSAGGHLALMTGLMGRGETAVQTVVSYYGAHDLNDGEQTDGEGRDAPVKLIGGTKEQKADLWNDALCSSHISRDCPPVLMIHGDRDVTVPISQSRKLLGLLQAAGVSAELLVVRGAGHCLAGGQFTPTLAEIDRKLLAFLDAHLK